MSTKCTVLSEHKTEDKNIHYHFYYDHKDGTYHLDHKNEESYKAFLIRAGNILEQCPFSDSGIYMIDMKGGKDKVIKNKQCQLLKQAKVKQ